MRRYLATEHEEEILESAVSENKKFEFDKIQRDARLLTLAINSVSRCIQYEFDRPNAIITVANGATCMGDPIVRQTEVRHIRTAYQNVDDKKLYYSLDSIKPNEKVIVVDDIYESGTSSGRVVDLLIRHGAVPLGVVALLNQSGEEQPQCRSLPVHCIIQKTPE